MQNQAQMAWLAAIHCEKKSSIRNPDTIATIDINILAPLAEAQNKLGKGKK